MPAKYALFIGGGQEELPLKYKEFKTIYKQEFGTDLTNEEAYEQGIRLLNFAKTIYKLTVKKQYQRSQEHDQK